MKTITPEEIKTLKDAYDILIKHFNYDDDLLMDANKHGCKVSTAWNELYCVIRYLKNRRK